MGLFQRERRWFGSVVAACGEDQFLVFIAESDGLGEEILGLKRASIGTGEGALDGSPTGENLQCPSLVRHAPPHGLPR
jgi:hypothetical protein